jgi:hypothetical protein
MEKGSDQITKIWQNQVYKDETIHLGKIDRYAKEGVSFLTCCFSLFIFWVITAHITFVAIELYASEWSQFPKIIKSLPHGKLLTAATIITISSAIISSIFKKISLIREDFPLIRLFTKNAKSKPSRALKGFRHD